ncbi:MAG: GNAT family N-acetyltransferase [Thermomicrobiales bacterium]
MDPTDIAIRPLLAAEIAQLERAPWSSGLKEKHRLRHLRQREGEAAYLIFWHGDTPIGHLFLKWSGPHDPQVAAKITDCAEIEDFVVVPALRSQGIGSRALDHAAALAREHGLQRLGLSVGLDNPRARAPTNASASPTPTAASSSSAGNTPAKTATNTGPNTVPARQRLGDFRSQSVK